MNVLVLGGNRFFGKRLVARLLDQGRNVTLLHRGNFDDGFGDQVTHFRCDRRDFAKMQELFAHQSWDIVYDQICYNYHDAKDACEIFAGKVGKYIYTSSLSVYPEEHHLVESRFDPSSYPTITPQDTDPSYAEGKREAEKAFVDLASFPVTMVRFPIVIGPDDYTQRLTFHQNRIRDAQPIFFPNFDARMSFVASSFAAEALDFLGKSDFTGPINVASPDDIVLRDLIGMIEDISGKKVIQAEEKTPENRSPFGVYGDWTMDCSLLASLGLQGRPVKEEVQALIKG